MTKKRLSSVTYDELNEMARKKPPESKWEKYEEDFPSLPLFKRLKTLKDHRLRKMFGGLAFYKGNRLLFYICESPHDYSWKNKEFDFPIWDGFLIVTDRKHHEDLKAIFPTAIPHPVLPKWLMVKKKDPHWKKHIRKLIQLIESKSELVGVTSKKRSSRRKASSTTS